MSETTEPVKVGDVVQLVQKSTGRVIREGRIQEIYLHILDQELWGDLPPELRIDVKWNYKDFDLGNFKYPC